MISGARRLTRRPVAREREGSDLSSSFCSLCKDDAAALALAAVRDAVRKGAGQSFDWLDCGL